MQIDAAALGKIPELMNQQKLTTRLQVAIYFFCFINYTLALSNFIFFGQLQKRLALAMQTNEAVDG